MAAILDFLTSIVGKEQVREQESLAKHTSFRVGGEAKYFVEIDTIEHLSQIVCYLKETEYPYYILGNGSNLLVSDLGYNGIILHIGSEFEGVEIDGNKIRVKAGSLLSATAKAAAKASLSGMEFAAGIPGSIGGAIVMNAGAYGGEMKDIVKEVMVMDKDGEILVLDNATMEFSYRTSSIKNKPFIVLEVVLELNPGDRDAIYLQMEELAKQRREKQPLEYPSAGSTFKRPEGYFAGKLIMDAGLRGYTVGGAMISEKHCGFVVNKGDATADDIMQVIYDVTKCVKDKYEVTLEREVITLGDFS